MKRREFLRYMGSLLPYYLLPDYEKNQNNEVTICGAGDVTLGGAFPYMFEKVKKENGEDKAFKAPFEKVCKYFCDSDINIVNLEGALTNSNKIRPKKFNFKGDPKYAKCLNEGNIPIVNLANNHIMDFYEEGALDTICTLNDCNIKYCGAGKNIEDASTPRFLERNNVKVGFLGYAWVGADYPAKKASAGTNQINKEKIKNEVRDAKDNCNVLVVSTHWGDERESYPNSIQKDFGKLIIDSGADIIFAHHPHVLQGIEKYNNGIIFYSLGNFAFGGNTFPSDRDSMIAKVKCTKNGVNNFEVVPIITHPQCGIYQPFVPSDGERIIDKLKERSKSLLNEEIKMLI
ncbi:MAG: CapA family protein [Candidatus Pacearchaeota archaeon]|jgi:poly-gamma-glutamate synthesis protein (capsule biosynthesis protein)